jgi:hypothetical protein
MSTESLKEKLARAKAQNTGTSRVQSPEKIPLVPAAQLAQLEQKQAAAPTPPSPVPNFAELEAIQGFDANNFLSLLSKLHTEVSNKAPGIPTYLKEISKNLNQYQELAYLLNDTQLEILTSGFFAMTNTKMAEVVVKSKKGAVTIDEAELLFS